MTESYYYVCPLEFFNPEKMQAFFDENEPDFASVYVKEPRADLVHAGIYETGPMGDMILMPAPEWLEVLIREAGEASSLDFLHHNRSPEFHEIKDLEDGAYSSDLLDPPDENYCEFIEVKEGKVRWCDVSGESLCDFVAIDVFCRKKG